MNTTPMGIWLITAGVILVIAGLFLYLAPGWFSHFGKLPGDIRVEHEHFKFYFPITTCIIISIVLTVLFYIISRLR